MNEILEFIKWISAQKSRALVVILFVSILIGEGVVIIYQYKQAVKNEEISRNIDREYDSNLRNITARFDSINRVREVETKEIYKQYNEAIERVSNDYRDLYLKSQNLKNKY
jgi:hypothetical protein